MLEYLALPAWETPPRTLDEWVAGLSEAAGPATLKRESPTVAWLEVASLKLRGYVVIEDGHPTAINFELRDPDPGPATRAIEAATSALGWELHADDETDSEEEDDD